MVEVDCERTLRAQATRVDNGLLPGVQGRIVLTIRGEDDSTVPDSCGLALPRQFVLVIIEVLAQNPEIIMRGQLISIEAESFDTH